MKPIPYGKQEITDLDIEAVVKTLRSDYLTQGPKIKEFEDAFANYVGACYAVAVSNGTAALHLSNLALGVKEGDKVITSPITFAASANCVEYCGGEVVFADINPDTYLIDIDQVRGLLESSPKGTYKGVIPVDFAGYPVNLEEFRKLADEFGLWIIEDACHAPGGFYKTKSGKKSFCGGGEFEDLAIFSFHPVKHIAAGEGGMITTNNEGLYQKLLTLRSHGITRDELLFSNSPSFAAGQSTSEYPGWYMEMQDLGYNYRITDIQAALGLSQLERADKGLEKRVALAKRYDNAFKNIPTIKSQLNELKEKNFLHAYHLYIIQVSDRLGLYKHLKENNIFTQIHYIPTHLMPYYKNKGWKEGDLPQAEEYYKHCISLPMFPTLSIEEQDLVIEKVIEFCR